MTIDVLGEPYTVETLALEDDFEGEVVATLVKRPADEDPKGAVLYVHGFSDYFFQTEYAEWWTSRGYDFYGIDLRKYGRSLREHQSGTYVGDLAEYFDELDAAWELITGRDGHSQVVLSGHSTGGLTVSLWADERQPEALAAMVLNSPWLDLQGSFLAREVLTPVVRGIGHRLPLRELGRDVTGFYPKSLHVDHDGEWEFDLGLKPIGSYPIRLGWLKAIRDGHARVHRGLDVKVPVLVLSSDRSSKPTEMGEDAHSTDIVLDVRQIRRWSTSIGTHVTYVAVPGAKHDVILSRPDVRKQAYAEIERWLAAYGV
ncbi:alpha-beta hydrolase superfamily lysophospholipase [Nocardioides albertanoniae]|uniref:Alpha-beta hydrolase superfamily lysophospholipase n=1 Tax=Nocardioides albertanoniae TaxID=1175486 RepID=A0A543A6P7_9ACTN|nr:alpha/beta hydrolase [Nocardioides albertanoniae]TQL68199.1 alpha-beta hydrolase superfamily lysophospholipase [Nocardioides albertanoniae]